MAGGATSAQARRGGQFAFARRTVAADDEPADRDATELTCAVTGAAARFLSADHEFAIWSAATEDAIEPDENATADGDRPATERRAITIKGGLGRVEPGDTLHCEGRWQHHARYGWSFDVTAYQPILPKTASGITVWLQTKVAGVGPTFARAIVDHFGEGGVFDALDADPERLREVRTAKGRKIPERQLERAIGAWSQAKAIRELESFLFSLGITARLADRLYRAYGHEVVDLIQQDPYRLVEVRGIGFAMADRIARSTGTTPDDPRRVQAGLLYSLDQAAADGHTFLYVPQLFERTAKILALPTGDDQGSWGYESRDAESLGGGGERLAYQLEDLRRGGKVVVEPAGAGGAANDPAVPDDPHDPPDTGPRVYLLRMFELEERLARNLRALLEPPAAPLMSQPARPDPPAAPGAAASPGAHPSPPTDDQWSVVEMVRTHRLAVLTGGPGVGKTHTERVLVDLLGAADRTVRLCAPTGKAARRMSELTGMAASTIHRLLEFSPKDGGFLRDEENTIEADCVIVDEASMLSIDLADSLMRAIGPSTHVLLVGDPDQLPPVGPGQVLADVLALEDAPRVHLSRIFRQAARSMIVQNARRINAGKGPYLERRVAAAELDQEEMTEDFYWIKRSGGESVRATIVEVVCERIPARFGLDPARDIMVLAPMRKGHAGVTALNLELEERLNPAPAGKAKRMVLPLRGVAVGSRIVQTKNDYAPEREVMNGEIATVLAYDEEDQECLIALDDGERELVVPLANMDTYELAWAMTIHKAQGSEFPCVVAPVAGEHSIMLSRALTYTAITRAKRLCVMVGELPALYRAVKGGRSRERNSGLADRVRAATLT